MSTDSEACFMLCECGRHGYIDAGEEVTPDDVFCMRDARALVGKLAHDYVITDEERDKLLFEIRESGLPEDIDPLMRRMLENDAAFEDQIDSMLSREPTRTEKVPISLDEDEYVEGIHELLDRYFPDRQGPRLLN